MKLSFVQKLWLPLILSLLCLAGISIYEAYQTREVRLDERKADLKHASELALSVVKTVGDQVAAGSMPLAEAQKRAMDSIRNMRFGKDGYFMILNSQSHILMHPAKAELNGMDVVDYKDPNGVYLFREMVAVIKHDGKGFTAYTAAKPAVVKTAPDDRSSLLFSMKRMQEQLMQTIGAIKISADSIATAAHQIAAGNQDLSQRTEEQAASLEETASSMEQLTSTVTQNADNASQANQLAAQAAQVAEQGGTVVSRVVETMEGINASSDRIANIVGIIEGIAFQTNILALNARPSKRRGRASKGGVLRWWPPKCVRWHSVLRRQPRKSRI
ncbi:hypothetical protein OKW38_005530 [Paraburkholderia sp. MM5496-R1]